MPLVQRQVGQPTIQGFYTDKVSSLFWHIFEKNIFLLQIILTDQSIL